MIPMNDKYYNKIYKGEKVQTIRNGRRNIDLGRNTLVFDDKPNMDIIVQSITYKWYGNISQREVELDGFETKKELMEELVSYYPNLRMTSEMSLIKFIVVDED